jgi:glycosyltransferase involved in cell wall biosynthesis
MKILLVSGSYPPDPCGVGDYTHRLSQALQSEGMDVQCLGHKQWHSHNIRSILHAVDNAGADIIHIQYPTVGYGRALGPQLLGIRRPCVVTIHEVSQAHLLRKLSLYAFLGFAKALIFTSKFEQQVAAGFAPWILHKSTIIPIGSNIPVCGSVAGTSPNTIGYFGLIRPNKGLEQVIELARLAVKNRIDFKVLVVGLEKNGQQDYYKRLRQQSFGLPVEWRVGLQGEDLDAALAEPKLAYLPFPDGASERRSSLLTFLTRGTPVITTMGPQVPEGMKSAVQFAALPDDALSLAVKMVADNGVWRGLREKGIAYAKSFAWDRIARRHIELYQNQMLPRRGLTFAK